MAVESLFQGATLRDRFVAAVARDDETAAHLLTPTAGGPEDPNAQRNDAWKLLTAGARWAGAALDSIGLTGTSTAPIRDSEAAFQRAQHLDRKLWELSQQGGFHDREALLVESVKRACYRGADLGPIPGGRLASLKSPGGPPRVILPVDAHPEDLQAIGSDLGEALRRLADLGLGDPVQEAIAALGENQRGT
jgi:hypothetical protein